MAGKLFLLLIKTEKESLAFLNLTKAFWHLIVAAGEPPARETKARKPVRAKKEEEYAGITVCDKSFLAFLIGAAGRPPAREKRAHKPVRVKRSLCGYNKRTPHHRCMELWFIR